jgi:serine phosphatase RsbU (regulator of sigma subunit)
MIFLTTDGIADQNNTQQQKYSTQRLKSILEQNVSLDMYLQKNLLQTDLENYMQGVEQRDDITVMGIKL